MQISSRIKLILNIGLMGGWMACTTPATPLSTPKNSGDSLVFYPYGLKIGAAIKTIAQQHSKFLLSITNLATQQQTRKFIDTASFQNFCRSFWEEDITTPSLKSFYKETVFENSITHHIVLNYFSTDKTLPVQQVDIYLEPQQQALDRVEIKKNYWAQDSLITEILVWQKDTACYKIKHLTSKEGKQISEKYHISWKQNQK